jgi:hypothetical protein
MAGDLAGAHAAGVHRHDVLIETGKAPLILGDQLGVEAALAVPRHLQPDPAGVGDHALAAIAVAAVPGAGFTRQVMVHLGVQRPLGQRLLQLIQQAALVKGRAGIGTRQELVQHLIRDPRRFAAGHGGAPSFPS